MSRDWTPAEYRAAELVIDTLREVKKRTGHGRVLVAVEVVAGVETMFETTPTFKEKPPR
jgi:hypothetical protein